MSIWDQLINFLSTYQADPATYLLIFFLFCVAAAIILPIPVEIPLVINPSVPFVLKAIVLGLGKGAGAAGVFYIGMGIEKTVMKFKRWGWFRWLLEKSEKFVRKYGYFAMFAIMSIPGMVDMIPLYVFSILNKEGKLMTLRGFVVVNILAGITRAALIYLIFYILDIPIFSPST